MKRFADNVMRFCVLFLLMLPTAVAVHGGVAYGVADVPNVHLADRTRYVTNPDGVLSGDAEARLNSMLVALRDSTTAEMVVVAVDDIKDYEVNQFATKLFEEWGLGKQDRDNGLLLLIVKERRQVVIRTGRGVEGVLPDVACGRIIRNVIRPAFREGDYDGGTEQAVAMMAGILADPASAGDVISALPDEDGRYGAVDNDLTPEMALGFLGGLGALMALVLLVALVWCLRSTRGRSIPERWHALSMIRNLGLFACFLGIGIPLIAFLPTMMVMRRMRRRHDRCANCNSRMRRLDEETDNQYLTQAQDAEERMNSIDYDVWLCDNCGTIDVIPFVNRATSYTVCPHCGARACTLAREQVTVRPTTAREGVGVRTFACCNCHNVSQVPYKIAKLTVAPVVIGGFGSGSGGGFSGGSFGGGMTGGGGASGGW